MRRAAAGRRGLTILEVLIALAIFLLGFGALHQLMMNSTRQAQVIHHRSQAARLAQSLLNEVAAGSLPIQGTVTAAPIPEDPDYTYSMVSEGTTLPGLYTVRITVLREFSESERIEYTLTQMTLDPAYVGSNQDQTAIQGQAETQGATTESTGSTGSTGTEGSGNMGGSTNPMSPSNPSGGGPQAGGGMGRSMPNLPPGLADLLPSGGGRPSGQQIQNIINQLPANIRNQIPQNLMPSGGGGRGGMGGAGGFGGGRGGR